MFEFRDSKDKPLFVECSGSNLNRLRAAVISKIQREYGCSMQFRKGTKIQYPTKYFYLD
jgi:hypothetical protein